MESDRFIEVPLREACISGPVAKTLTLAKQGPGTLRLRIVTDEEYAPAPTALTLRVSEYFGGPLVQQIAATIEGTPPEAEANLATLSTLASGTYWWDAVATVSGRSIVLAHGPLVTMP